MMGSKNGSCWKCIFLCECHTTTVEIDGSTNVFTLLHGCWYTSYGMDVGKAALCMPVPFLHVIWMDDCLYPFELFTQLFAHILSSENVEKSEGEVRSTRNGKRVMNSRLFVRVHHHHMSTYNLTFCFLPTTSSAVPFHPSCARFLWTRLPYMNKFLPQHTRLLTLIITPEPAIKTTLYHVKVAHPHPVHFPLITRIGENSRLYKSLFTQVS